MSLYYENSIITLEEYIDLFCSTYVKTLSLVECPLYSKQLITWKKMKKVVLQGDI